MLKVLRELLVGIIDDIDTGNTNIEEEDEVKIIESLRQYIAAKLFMCDNCRTKLTEIIGEG